MNSVDSLLDEKYLKKKRILHPDTQGSSKSSRTVMKEKNIPWTELGEGGSRKRKKEILKLTGASKESSLTRNSA